jgi:chromosome segregation ATPase
MPKTTDTYARAYDACATVFSELARFPTIDLVRDRIGVNSPVVIKRAITDWTLAFAERYREKSTRPELPSTLIEAAEALWQRALAEADARFAGERQAWTDQQRQWDQTLAEARETGAALAGELDANRRSLAAQEARTAELQRQLDAERAARTQAEAALADVRSELAILAATLMAERDQFAARHNEWEQRLEAQHTWHLQRIEEEKDRLRIAQQHALAQRDAELARLTLDGQRLETRLRTVEEQAAEARGRLAATGDSLTATRAALADKERTLAETTAHLAELQSALAAATAALAWQRRPAEAPASAEEA